MHTRNLLRSLIPICGLVASLPGQTRPRHWATYLGGADSREMATAVATAANGDVILVGHSHGADFPTTPGVFQPKKSGFEDVFVARLSPDGKRLLRATFLGGSHRDLATSVHVASDGSIWVGGTTQSTDFPTTADAFTKHVNRRDSFVANLDASLAKLRYATAFGSMGEDRGEAIAVDEAAKRIYISGLTDGAVPTTSSGFRRTTKAADVFLAVLDRSTPGKTTLHYGTLMGGSGVEGTLDGLSIDAAGVATLTGTTFATDFPVLATAFQSTRKGGVSGFVARIDPQKSGAQSLVYASYFGGSADDTTLHHALGTGGVLHLLLTSFSPDLPATRNALQAKPGGNIDPFYAQLDCTKSKGAGLLYGTWIAAGRGSEGTGRIALHGSRVAISVHASSSTPSLPTTAGAFQASAGGARGYAVILDLAAANPRLEYATFYGGCGAGFLKPLAVAFHRSGDLLLAGQAGSAPITPGAFQMQRASLEPFVGRLQPAPWPSPFRTLGASCPGSAGTPVLAGVVPARMCKSTRVQATRLVPQRAGIFFLGPHTAWNNIPLPLRLTSTGCSLHVGPDVILPVPTGSGTATLTLGIPFAPQLIGIEFGLQYVFHDPAANSLGWVLTNGVAAQVRW